MISKKLTPFDYLNSITEKKNYYNDLSGYDPYVVNKGLSLFYDTIMYANDINMYPDLSISQMYDYFYFAIKKGKRYSKWPKQLEYSDDIKFLSELYQINMDEAITYAELLGPEKIAILKEENDG